MSQTQIFQMEIESKTAHLCGFFHNDKVYQEYQLRNSASLKIF